MTDSSGSSHTGAIRTFICMGLPESVKVRIEKLQRELRQIEAQVSWVKAANIHLTLKFLGDVPQAKIPLIAAAVKLAIGSCGPFQVAVGGAGCFPSLRNPTVLWIGVSPIPEALTQIYEAMEEELARQGFARETKRFKPHLTIARLRNPRNTKAVADAFMACGFEDESFQASEVIVMRSDLTPRGSIYTPQAVIPLKG